MDYFTLEDIIVEFNVTGSQHFTLSVLQLVKFVNEVPQYSGFF